MPRNIEIDRCTCYDLRFAELKAYAERERGHANRMTADEIGKRYGCGSCCGLCRPYIERMLETGQTVFHDLLVADDARGNASVEQRES